MTREDPSISLSPFPEVPLAGGTAETKRYYDEEGWTRLPDGRTKDLARWGAWEVGPLRVAAHELRMARAREALAVAGESLNLLECGCGGHPEVGLLDLCANYTGLDFSLAGLRLSTEILKKIGVPFTLVHGDVCRLPFESDSFDAVYSAHTLYHIRDSKAQASAFREILRVTRPGGVAVLILANPRPLMFPGRFIRRVIADAPGLGYLANRLRTPAPIPFNPRPLGWMRRQLEPFGTVEITGHSVASVWVDHHVTEKRALGRAAWRAMLRLQRDYPRLSARLGNYVQITIRKHS